MRDWAEETALVMTKVEGAGLRLTLALVAGHWSNRARVAFPGTRRIAELSGCSLSTASRRLSRLVASGDLIVEVRGRGKRATRYRVPALDDAVARGGLAFASEGTLRPFSFASGRNANDLDDLDDPRSVPRDPRSVPLASRLGGTEVRSNEVETRAREDEPVSSSSSRGDSSDPDLDRIAEMLGATVSRVTRETRLHYADEDERDRVRSTSIADARRSLGLGGETS